jgi:Domain of unknown function (DUF4198)
MTDLLTAAPQALGRTLALGLVAACLAGHGGGAAAHDTWFQAAPAARPATLLLGTGNRFPVFESGLAMEHLQHHGCAAHSALAARGAAAAEPLAPAATPAGQPPDALRLHLPPATPAQPVSCWASLVAFDVEIAPPQVQTYLREIAAGPALREAWAAEQAAGRPWRERYVKHARIELGGASATAVGLALEAVLIDPAQPRVREAARFQLLHGGRPLADQPVQWVSERSGLGVWRRTDAQGQVVLALPLAGNWLLRSTLLRPPARAGEPWESDFVTLAFAVDGAAR